MLQGVACGGAAIPSGEHLRHASRDGKARSPQFMAPPCNAPESASRAAVSRRRGEWSSKVCRANPASCRRLSILIRVACHARHEPSVTRACPSPRRYRSLTPNSPPGTSSRRKPRSTSNGFTRSERTHSQNTIFMLPSAKGRFAAFATMTGTPCRSLALVVWAVLWSHPKAEAPYRCRRCSTVAPVPQPTSSTRQPGWIPASVASLSVSEKPPGRNVSPSASRAPGRAHKGSPDAHVVSADGSLPLSPGGALPVAGWVIPVTTGVTCPPAGAPPVPSCPWRVLRE